MLHQLIDILLHLDIYLNTWIITFGSGIYGILFLIVFCETGLIVTPFLPGDSLLFALGALTATENAFLGLPLTAAVMIAAALCGDITNYSIGKFLGMKLFSNPQSKIFRREYLDRTHRFYEKNGGKTIILARFMPIIRTFAPFVAGLGKMTYARYLLFCVVGAALWVISFLAAGHYFGALPVVKRNFHIVIVAIVIISFAPVALEWWKARKVKNS